MIQVNFTCAFSVQARLTLLDLHEICILKLSMMKVRPQTFPSRFSRENLFHIFFQQPWDLNSSKSKSNKFGIFFSICVSLHSISHFSLAQKKIPIRCNLLFLCWINLSSNKEEKIQKILLFIVSINAFIKKLKEKFKAQWFKQFKPTHQICLSSSEFVWKPWNCREPSTGSRKISGPFFNYFPLLTLPQEERRKTYNWDSIWPHNSNFTSKLSICGKRISEINSTVIRAPYLALIAF